MVNLYSVSPRRLIDRVEDILFYKKFIFLVKE